MKTAGKNRTAAMGFEEFVSMMRERLQEQYPECKAEAVHVDKNNGLRLAGIAIIPEGQYVAPAIYMENFYEEYLAGRRIEDIADAAARFHEENKLHDFMLPDVADFEAVKDLICFRPVNRERNREMLKSMPHRDFLDLAVTYYIPVTVGGGMDGRITVTDRHFCMWGVDEGPYTAMRRKTHRGCCPWNCSP